MDVRRWIAGRLIRLAHKVYPPKVTEFDPAGFRDAGLLAGIELASQLAEANARA